MEPSEYLVAMNDWVKELDQSNEELMSRILTTVVAVSAQMDWQIVKKELE